MEEWKVFNEKFIELDKNNFIEITLKTPPSSENKLIAISKGWINNNGERRYKSNILFSIEKKDEIIKALEEIEKED